jgi:hypothetical protein
VRARFKPRKPVPPAITIRPDGFASSEVAGSDIVIRFLKIATRPMGGITKLLS